MWNIVYIGSSMFGLECLKALMSLDEVQVTGVVTNCKEFEISYSKEPVKNVLYANVRTFCEHNSIDCYVMQTNMKEYDLEKKIQEWEPDMIFVAGWYHIIPKNIRKIPHYGVVGFHASLLPKYRGGAPVVWAIINGETHVGISLFRFDDGVDTGNIIVQRKIPVFFRDNISDVYAKIQSKGIKIIKSSILGYLKGQIIPYKQEMCNEYINQWPQRCPKDGEIFWENMTPIALYNFIRAQTFPYPGAFSYIGKKKIVILTAWLYPYLYSEKSAGEVIDFIENANLEGVLIATVNEDVPLLITKVQVEDVIYEGKDLIDFFKNYINSNNNIVLGKGIF